MTAESTPSVESLTRRKSLVLGLGRPQERRLLAMLREDARIRIVARCASAPEALAAVRDASADVALLDEDLHLLDDEQLDHFRRARVPTIVIAREPDAEQWQHWQELALVSAEAGVSEILRAIYEAQSDRPRRGPLPGPKESVPNIPTVVERPPHLQVLSFWSGAGSPGRTTLAINWGVLLGWVARTVIVDLDLTGGSVTAQLDQARPDIAGRGWVASSILQIASANPDSAERWGHEIFRVARPLGPLSPQADVLAGVLQPWLRDAISATFVERLIAELRRHYTYILLDLGDEPLGEHSRESAVNAAALGASDQIIVVCPPDGPGLHQTHLALAHAGSVLDRARAGLVINRYDKRHHQADVAQIEDALGLPLVGLLPTDFSAVQRALSEGRPVVCDRRSKVRRPLQELAERLHGGRLVMQEPRQKGVGLSWPGRMRAAVTGLTGAATVLGGR